MTEVVVTVTEKGQATIPKTMREKHKIGRKALAVDTDKGVLMKPIPDPAKEKGSLKGLFKGKSSSEIMNEVRQEEESRIERKLVKEKKAR
ncbi:MAG: AbrB/MazE/SpoVT family DNA-binding domain-containing protein [Nitrososphaerales archaeon]